MGSQCHSSRRLFHLPPRPGQITYYITVHLVSKDTLTTLLKMDEKSCSVLLLLAPKCVPLLRVYVCARLSICMCRKTYNVTPTAAFTDVITLFYHPFSRKCIFYLLCSHIERTAAVSTAFLLWVMMIPRCSTMCCDKACVITTVN